METKRNPADKDSRFDNQRQHGVFAKHHRNFPFDRGKLPGLPVDSVSKGNPLPSSTTSVRGSATAISGRGGTKETPTTPGPGEVKMQSASQRLAAELGGGKRNHCRASVNAKPLVLGNQTSSSSASRSGTTSRSSGMFLEIFSGSGRLTAAVRDTGAATLSPVEVKLGAHFDMRRRSSQITVLAWVRSGRIAYVHLGTPCTVFSRARHNISNFERAKEKERVGLELALFTTEIILTCIKCGVGWSLENPRNNRLFELPVLSTLLQHRGVYRICLDFCRYGEPYKKPTTIYTNVDGLQNLEMLCNHVRHAVVLRGSEIVVEWGKRCSVPKSSGCVSFQSRQKMGPSDRVATWSQ